MDKNTTKFITADFNLPSYIIFPRFLLESDLSETTMLLYAVLLDRTKLSIKNDGWTDEKGHIFIYFTIKNLAKQLNKSETTIKNSLSALAEENLIFRKRQGAGKPNRLYVKVPTNCLSPSEAVRKPTDRKSQNCPNDSRKIDFQTDEKLPANNNDTNKNYLTNKESKASTARGSYKNVFLSEREYAAMISEFSIAKVDDYIERLSVHMSSTGKSYANHSATIRKWILKDKQTIKTDTANKFYVRKEGESL